MEMPYEYACVSGFSMRIRPITDRACQSPNAAGRGNRLLGSRTRFRCGMAGIAGRVCVRDVVTKLQRVVVLARS